LFCPNSHYSGKKTDYQTNKQKKTNIKRDVCLHSDKVFYFDYRCIFIRKKMGTTHRFRHAENRF
ncbi:hypothetical protein, partial [Streptococcus suis]|uniref:hypothetical protein n=1 Tax=Streptococcus suis TaxID=1307 RepID=UPI001EE7D1B9